MRCHFDIGIGENEFFQKIRSKCVGEKILKSLSDFLKKFIFIDSNIKMTSHIDVGILKCLNFFILQKKLKKNMPPTRFLDQKSKKAEKCVFSQQG